MGVISVARDISDLKRTEVSQRILAEAGRVLATSLDYASRLTNVAQLAVPDLADWCAVDVVEEDETVRRVAVAHTDPAKVELAHALYERYPPDWETQSGVPNVIRTGQPELYPEISDELLEAAARDAEHFQILRELRMNSAMVIPLNARGRTLGAITFVWADSGRRYDTSDQDLAEKLAHRAAMALDNARLYEAEQEARRVAELTAARITSLQAITAALSEALTPAQVARIIIEQGLSVLVQCQINYDKLG